MRAAAARVDTEMVRAQRRLTLLLVVGLAAVLLSGADSASAFISANTIDERAGYRKGGGLVRVTGPVRCTRGERVSIGVAVRQRATAAGARGRWKGRCRGEVQRWQVRLRARRGGSRFEDGRGRVCAVAETRSGSRVTDRRRWCERVTVVALGIPGRGKTVTAAEVCFAVNNIGDPIASTVRGTLFRSAKRGRSRSTALLLQHGAVAERSAWSGGAPVIAGTHDMARSLARAGYAVFAIDRLGYGESPYQGSGFLLTPDGYVEMTHQMVTQIRAGSHTDCAGNAAGRGAARVVLSGFSSGAGIIEGYATRYRDIDGIIPMSWSNQPQLSTAFRTLIDVLVPQLPAGKDYVEFFTDGADGYSEFCEEFLFYPRGMRRRALEQLCGLDYYAETAFPTPSGEAALPALQAATIAAIGNVGPTPALLVFPDRDAAFPGAEHRGADPDLVTPEIAMWQNACNCDVSVYVQKNAGHVGLFHKTGKQ
jgi:pimeloyl-ACP methyl ester carboxylesterase